MHLRQFWNAEYIFGAKLKNFMQIFFGLCRFVDSYQIRQLNCEQTVQIRAEVDQKNNDYILKKQTKTERGLENQKNNFVARNSKELYCLEHALILF